MEDQRQRIESLTDQEAVTTLALVAERHGLALDATTMKTIESHLRDALQQPDVAEYAELGEAASRGGIARASLLALISDERYAHEVARAIEIGPRDERFEPATLAIGALVLFAFHAHIKLKKQPEKGWTFEFETKPLADATIGRILGKLYAVYFGGG